MSSKNNSIPVSLTETGELSKARKSLRSAVALNKPKYKGDAVNPSYAIDAEAEGMDAAVDRSDDGMTAIELGTKYKELFGNIQIVIINMSGTMVEDFQEPLKPFPGAAEAYGMLKELDDITLVIMANSWKLSKNSIVETLKTEGFDVGVDDIFTSSDACKLHLKEKNLDRPYYLVHPDVYRDFAEEYPRRHGENCVIVGLPSTQFDYRWLSKGMSLLTDGVPMIALNMMKGAIPPNVRNSTLGPGPFISMLSACTDAQPVTVCKPSRFFYECLCKKINCSDYSKAVVIGDDINEDIAGAKSLGLKTILTRTGRYHLKDEKLACPGMAPDTTAENFVMAIRCLLASFAVSQMTEADFIDEEKSSKGCSSIDSAHKEDLLSKKVEGYAKTEFKSKHSPADGNNNPLGVPSFVW